MTDGEKKALKHANSQIAKTFETYKEAEIMVKKLSEYAEEHVEWYIEKK